MKKIFWILIVICLLVVFCGCTDESNTQFAKLNNLVQQARANFTLTVSTDADTADALTSTFIVATEDGQTNIQYTIEQFVTFDDITPESCKKQICGNAVVKNGEIVNVTGDSSNLSFNKLADLSFGFKAENFSNATWTENGFSAYVTKPMAFLAGATNCTDMQVKVAFAETLQSVQVSYTSQSGAKVLLQYIFGK